MSGWHTITTIETDRREFFVRLVRDLSARHPHAVTFTTRDGYPALAAMYSRGWDVITLDSEWLSIVIVPATGVTS